MGSSDYIQSDWVSDISSEFKSMQFTIHITTLFGVLKTLAVLLSICYSASMAFVHIISNGFHQLKFAHVVITLKHQFFVD